MESANQLETPIIIVGGGPVGVVLVLLLDFYGVRSTIINTEPNERWHPKGNGRSARTIEIYRQLGFSDQVHLVGSIGLDTVEEVFTVVGGLPGRRIKRVPGKEPEDGGLP